MTIDPEAHAPARFDGSRRSVMIMVLVLIAILGLCFGGCVLLLADQGYRWWRAPVPTILPRNLPTVVDKARPVGRYADWFGPDDYPTSAARNGQEGSVRVAILVGSDGAVEACEILSSSGTRALDRGTCRAAVRHGRFTPARDARHHAIPSRIELPRVRWVLPSDER